MAFFILLGLCIVAAVISVASARIATEAARKALANNPHRPQPNLYAVSNNG